MLMCEHQAQTILQQQILPIFDLSPLDDSLTQSLVPGPLSEK